MSFCVRLCCCVRVFFVECQLKIHDGFFPGFVFGGQKGLFHCLFNGWGHQLFGLLAVQNTKPRATVDG